MKDKKRNPGARRRGGFSLIEIIIAVAVMVLALTTLMVAITSASRISDSSRERVIAYELAKSKLEEIRNFTRCGSFDKIFYFYGVQKATNGLIYKGNSTLPDPLGLNPAKVNGVAQPIITISFPVDNAGQLTEGTPADSDLATIFGMPKDLNRDGDTGDSGATLYSTTGGSAPATAYKIIPVRVLVQWESIGKKNGRIELSTFIADK